MSIRGFAERNLKVAEATYRKNERILGLVFFLSGILWDALTLRRIDNLVDNLILIGYLLLLTSILIVDIRFKRSDAPSARLKQAGSWVRPATQFLLGALLSAFLIFYSRSISWATNFGFLLVLVVGLVFNEFLNRRLSSFPAQLTLLFFCSASMFAYLFPVAAKFMSPWLFRAALVASLALCMSVFIIGKRAGRVKHRRFGPLEIWILVLATLAMDFAYQNNWIPPVPLSVEEGGVYNLVSRNGDSFRLEWDTQHRGIFAPEYARTFFYNEGDLVYCFTSVFAPTQLKERLYHVWQRYDSSAREWISTDRIGFDMRGGRSKGYRGMTLKRKVGVGEWRVIVETGEGKILTRIPFTIVARTAELVVERRTLTR